MPPKTSRRDAAVLREALVLFMFEQRRLLAELEAPQARLLIVLLRKAPVLQSELGRLLGLEKSWVSRAIDKLVALGWVVRNTAAEDRRNVLLQLSDEGRRVASEVDARMNEHAASVLDRLAADTRPQVIAALEALCVALREPEARA